MNTYIATLSKEKEFPIVIKNIITGAAKPNKDQLEEMNKTAQYIQQKRSMEQKSIAEQARADAEQKRAIADKAYMNLRQGFGSAFLYLYKMVRNPRF